MDPVKDNMSIYCYVKNTLLTDAMVTDCGHSFSEAALSEIFDRVIGSDEEPRCPIPKCNQQLSCYFPNLAMRKLVMQVDEAASNIKTKGKRPLEIPLASAVVKHHESEPVFPGKPAQFLHTSGNWNKINTSSFIKREIAFQSSEGDALFTNFCLDQCNNGVIRIWVHYQKNHPGLANYFNYHDITVTPRDIGFGWHITETADQLKRLFALVAKDNQIPVGHYQYLKQIVESAKF